MEGIKGFLTTKSVIKDPENIRELDQKSIIVYSRKINEIGITINIFLERNWKVHQCWTDPAMNHFVLFMKSED